DLPQRIGAERRPYEVDVYHFLACPTANRWGGVLADDMGLGKPLQTRAWLAWLRLGSTGAPPVPSGDSPDGRGGSAKTETSIVSIDERSSVPVGESPTGAGGAPARPSLVRFPKSVMGNTPPEGQSL